MKGQLLSIFCLVAIAALAANAKIIKIWVKPVDDPGRSLMFEVDADKETCEKIVLNYLKLTGMNEDLNNYSNIKLTDKNDKVYKLSDNIKASGIKKLQTLYLKL